VHEGHRGFHCILHKAASEVRYAAAFNNGGTTGPHGVSELGWVPGATQWGRGAYCQLLVGTHSPAEARLKSEVEVARKKWCVVGVGVGGGGW
jgi:hypothetical protein